MIRDLSQFDPEQYSPEIYVIGGAEIYTQLLDRCRELLITRVKTEYEGDVFFLSSNQNLLWSNRSAKSRTA
jgi:dihydrofolate reductase